jgi:hypothetical protein
LATLGDAPVENPRADDDAHLEQGVLGAYGLFIEVSRTCSSHGPLVGAVEAAAGDLTKSI